MRVTIPRELPIKSINTNLKPDTDGNVDITKSTVGLNNVDNTSDANKPISTAAQTALDLKAPLASPALTGTPTAPTATSGTSSTQIATTEFVMNAFRANDAMVYKGTIGSSEATVTSLPSIHYQGWTYKVITAGTYAGVSCEIGDMIICITDGVSDTDSHWSVVQSNIDGAVTGPASSTADHVVTFNGNSGKVVKDSGYTIAKSVPSDAAFTDTHYTTHLYAGTGTNANAETTNGNTKLAIADDTTVNNTVSIVGTGNATVTSNANGVITVNASDQYTGTITKVQVNGTDVASSGVANIPAATTVAYGATKLSSAVDSTSEALAATPKAVKTAYDLAASKKNVQAAVADPTASGNSITFISEISQNTQGVISPQKKTVSTMTGASSSAAGSAGLVPSPAAGDEGKVLYGDGTWKTPSGGDVKTVNSVIPDSQGDVKVKGSDIAVSGSDSTKIDTALSNKADKSDTYTKSQVDALLSSIFHFKGAKATYAEITALTNQAVGDVWICNADNSEYAWTGTAWEKFGPTIDLSAYLTSLTIAGIVVDASHATITSSQLMNAIGAVPTTRTINGHALSDNITITKSDVGLGNVDNTSDANKPISSAMQSALDDKANASSVYTKTQVDGMIPGVMTGATPSAGGTSGLVPASSAGDQHKFLCVNGDWENAPGSQTYVETVGPLTPTNGVLNQNFAISYVMAEMKAIQVEPSDASVFMDTLTVTMSEGNINVSCPNMTDTCESMAITFVLRSSAQGETITSSEFNTLATRIGNLESLTTTANTSTVAAINEVKSGVNTLNDQIANIAGDVAAVTSPASVASGVTVNAMQCRYYPHLKIVFLTFNITMTENIAHNGTIFTLPDTIGESAMQCNTDVSAVGSTGIAGRMVISRRNIIAFGNLSPASFVTGTIVYTTN